MKSLRKVLFIGLLGMVSSAQALVVDLTNGDTLPSASFFTYTYSDGYIVDESLFSSDYSNDINDGENNNISTSSSHVSIINIGTSQASHVYKFQAQEGELILDIDYGWTEGAVQTFDSLLRLYTGVDELFPFVATSTLLADNNDYYLADGVSLDNGTANELDSFIQFDQTGVQVGDWYYLHVLDVNATLNNVPAGQDYTLHIAFAQPVPEPSVIALMLGGIGLVGFMAMRKQRQQGSALAA